jgi:precorrin-6B methylase 2
MKPLPLLTSQATTPLRGAKLDITRGNVVDIGDGDGKVFVEWMVIAIGYGNGGAETGGSFIV